MAEFARQSSFHSTESVADKLIVAPGF